MLRRISLEGKSIFEVAEKAIEVRLRSREDFKLIFSGAEVRVSAQDTRGAIIKKILATQQTSQAA